MSDGEGENRHRMEGEGLTDTDWARALREGTLLGQECPKCGHRSATLSAACVRCGSRDCVSVELPQEGEVHSVSTLNVAGSQFEAPFQVAIVTLEDDTRITARIDGTVEIGDPVTFQRVIERDGRPAPVFE